METYNFEAMMKKQEAFNLQAEKNKINFFLKELSKEGKEYIKEILNRNNPDYEYLGRCKVYKELGLNYLDVDNLKNGKSEIQVIKKSKTKK